MIVDTHVHVGETWFEPVEALLFQMEHSGVEKAVLVQYGGNYHNDYELECVRRYPGRFAAVVLVDTNDPGAPEELERWTREGAVGVRLNASVRSPGADPLAIWRKASELGLVVSCSGRLEDFASEGFRRLVEELPQLPMVIEHLGGVRPEPELDYALFRKMLSLARYPHIYIKLPGFGEVLPRPARFGRETFGGPPLAVRLAYEAFGARRMMWGSDYPPSGGREGYANALYHPLKRIEFFTSDDREWIFGQTALAVWRFD